MMIIRKQRVIFVSCSGTGTHSMYAALGKYGGERYHSVKEHWRVIPSFAHDFIVLGLVRNPYRRAVSIWREVRDHRPGRKPGTNSDSGFTEYARYLATKRRRRLNAHLEDQNMVHWYAPVGVTQFLRTETLAADFAALPFVVEPIVPFPHLLIRAGSAWRSYYTPQAVKYVAQWAAPDFERFGYAKELPE